MKPTHDQPASYRARPLNVNDGLEDIMWIRCPGGERLPTASYALCPNLKKLRYFFCLEKRDQDFLSSVFYTPADDTPLDVESTHGQPASCRARPDNIDDDLQNRMWIHGLGGERLPAMSYALCPNLKKRLIFAIGEGLGFVVVYFYTPAAKCFFLKRLAGARHISQAFV